MFILTCSTVLFSREVYSFSDRWYDFAVTLPRFYKDIYVNSFFPRTAKLWNWNSLPIECFPLTCYLNSFQPRINPSSANHTKWPNTLRQFVGKLPTNCLSVFGHFLNLALKGLTFRKLKKFLSWERSSVFYRQSFANIFFCGKKQQMAIWWYFSLSLNLRITPTKL